MAWGKTSGTSNLFGSNLDVYGSNTAPSRAPTLPGTQVTTQPTLNVYRPPQAPTSNTPQSPQQWGGNTQPGQGLLDTPGWGEQWYEKNKGAWDQPSQASQYWSSVSGAFQGGKTMPQNTQAAYGTLQQQLGQPGQGTQQAYGNAGQLNGGNWAGDRYIQSALPYFQQTGQGEQYAAWAAPQTQSQGYGETAARDISGSLRNSGTGERYAQSALPYFQQQGQMEQLYPGLLREIQGIQYGNQAIGAAGSAVGSANATNRALPGLQRFAEENPIGDEYAYFAQGLRGPSFSEDLYTSGQGEAGLSTHYGREQAKQSRKIDDMMAARGLFGSSAAMRAQQELAAEIGSQQARDMAAMAGQADQARLGRTGEARAFTSAIDQSQQGRRRLGLDAASASDQNTQRNAGLLLDAYGMASGEALARTGQQREAASAAQGLGQDRMTRGINAALDTDRLGIDRMRNSADVALAGQDAMMNRLNTGSEIAFRGQTAGTNRMAAGVDAASTLDQNRATRLFQGGQLGISADAENRSRATDLFQGAATLDDQLAQSDRDYYTRLAQGAGIAGQADTSERARLSGGMDAATGAQNLFEGRNLTALGVDQSVAGTMSEIYRNLGSEGIQDYVNGQLVYIDGLVRDGQMSAADATAKKQGLMSAIGLFT